MSLPFPNMKHAVSPSDAGEHSAREFSNPSRGPRRPKRRRASVLLELIVALPILVIIVVATVQFGLYFQNMQQVALASRVGARVAAENASLPNGAANVSDPAVPVPSTIDAAIRRQLSNSGIEPCAIILEHNVNAQPAPEPNDPPTFPEQTLRTEFDNDANSMDDCPDCDEPSSAIPARTVRVTVCVKMDELMPNCLKMLGFDISTYTSQSTTTVCYELP